MVLQKVDTFQHDISDEIKAKDASAASVASAGGNIGNTPPITPKTPVLTIVVMVLFVCGLIGAIGVGYIYYQDMVASQLAAQTPLTQNSVPRAHVSLKGFSPTLDDAIGNYVTDIRKSDKGFTLTLNSYPPVFLYMVKNENAYIDEISSVLVTKKPKVATTTPKVAVVLQPTATTTGTSTKATAGTSTETVATSTGPIFEDITISNQNMRIWRDGESTVIYAFINTKALVFSTTTEGILSLRDAILH
jgi:hypothetical protein